MNKIMTPKDKILSIFELIASKQEFALKNRVISIDSRNEINSSITNDQLKSILVILEKEYAAIVIKTRPDYKKKFSYTLTVADNFEAIYDEVYSQAHFGINNLDDISLLKVIDIAFDINEQLKLTQRNVVQFNFFQQPIRFQRLFPIDSIAMRDQYMDYRWSGCQFLQEVGAINNFRNINGLHRWDNEIYIQVNRRKFDSVFMELQDKFRGYNKQLKPINNQSNPLPTTNKLVFLDKEVAPSLEYRDQTLNLDNSSLEYFIIKELFSTHPKAALDDDIIEAWGKTEKPQTLYDACGRLNTKLSTLMSLTDKDKVIDHKNSKFIFNDKYSDKISKTDSV